MTLLSWLVFGLLLEGVVWFPFFSHTGCVFLQPPVLALGVGSQHKPVWGMKLAENRPCHKMMLFISSILWVCTLWAQRSTGPAAGGMNMLHVGSSLGIRMVHLCCETTPWLHSGTACSWQLWV